MQSVQEGLLGTEETEPRGEGTSQGYPADGGLAQGLFTCLCSLPFLRQGTASSLGRLSDVHVLAEIRLSLPGSRQFSQEN